MARSVEFKVVELEGYVRGGASIRFLRAEVPVGDYWAPFAVVRYSLRGEEQEYGLRLDLDKEAFLDHFDDEAREAVLQQAAPEISDFLSQTAPAGTATESPAHAVSQQPHSFGRREMPAERVTDDEFEPQPTSRRRVFIGHTWNSARWAQRFRSRLSDIVPDELISQADASRAVNRATELEQMLEGLESAKVILMLLAGDFLYSDAFSENTLLPAVRHARDEGALILPLLITPLPSNHLDSLHIFAQLGTFKFGLEPLENLPRAEQRRMLDDVASFVAEALGTRRDDQ
jgi:hypothetical protein